MAEMRFLVVIETQRVKGYLFASPILRETRGASMLLDQLNRTETEKLLQATSGKEVVYLGGGSGRVLFSSKSEAERFAQRVRELYQQRTHNARVSVEVVQRDEGESLPDWMARGVRESQKNKLARVEAIPLLAGRWIRPCSSCGKEPAAEIPLPDVQGTHYLCVSCLYKRDEVSTFYHNVKRNWALNIPLPDVARLKKEWPNFILTTLAEAVQHRFGRHIRTLLPQDFNDIADCSKPRNYIGFIYADGNRMGETIKSMAKDFPTDDEHAKRAYTAFSAIVDQATREAAVQAVLDSVSVDESTTARGESARFVPAEFVLAGGDDLILVVPADTTLRVAARFISLFQEHTQQLQRTWVQQGKLPHPFALQGLTTSAGVVLAHASYPASQLMDLAGELMKLAKRKAADLAKKNPIEGTLDFMVLHTPGSERVKQRRKTEYEYEDKNSGRKIKRTERPYTVSQLSMLLEQIRGLKATAVPRTQLKALYPILFQSVMQAQFDAQHVKERLKATGALVDGPLQKLVAALPLFPFRTDAQGKEWSTPLSELIELYDFVQPDQAATSQEAAHA